MFNLTFLNPAYLWGLLAAAVPLTIHLWNKQEGKIIKISSTELLSEVDSKQTKTVYLNEVILLIIRVLMISLVVLIMADPMLPIPQSSDKQLAYLFEEELLADKSIKTIADSLSQTNEVRFFKEGFPQYEGKFNREKHEVPDYWQLISDFNSVQPDSLVVFTAARLQGLKGKRIEETSKSTHWIQVNKGQSISKVAYAYLIDSLNTAYIAHSDTSTLTFSKLQWVSNPPENLMIKGDKVRISKQDAWTELKEMKPIKIQLVYDQEYYDDIRFIEASLSVLKKGNTAKSFY
ncbi:BatA domain-containing protein [Fulvivirga maritima]|uniref:BatA domain-containing protein n=1 Tax=Fulvivirga maritima TaxID=2904247 RepID=UPI001F45EB90|nr:BatA domain-containing protein [Fulvivirga maritima]UII25936.1 BatA domain-containing protein [Fulvivirga maritima]